MVHTMAPSFARAAVRSLSYPKFRGASLYDALMGTLDQFEPIEGERLHRADDRAANSKTIR
jgi:hypothetical protein